MIITLIKVTFDSDKINELSYILIKNVEARDINIDKLNKEIFKNNATSNDDISRNLISLLNITDKKDISNIEIYIKTLNQDQGDDQEINFKERFLALFRDLMTYDKEKERKYKKRIQKVYNSLCYQLEIERI